MAILPESEYESEHVPSKLDVASSSLVSRCPEPPPPTPGQPSAGLQPEVGPGQSPLTEPMADATVWANPWGCRDRADNPHGSGHGPADVNSEGWVICNTKVGIQAAQVQSTLYRQDCVLFVCWWTNVTNNTGTIATTSYPQTSFRWGPSSGQQYILANATYDCNGNSTHAFYLNVYGIAMDYANNIYSQSLNSNSVNLACG